MGRAPKFGLLIALAFGAVVGSVASVDAHLSRNAHVVGTVSACKPGASTLARMKVSAVNAKQHVVKTEAVQGNKFSFKLVPGRYTIELKSLSGHEIAHHSVKAVADKTKTVNFTVPSPCTSG